MAKQLYNVLGLEETADLQAIKTAYKKLAFKYHPDKNLNSAAAAAEKFKEISAAYQILGDGEKRKQYDAGFINEKGDPIPKMASRPQPAPRPQPEPQTQAHQAKRSEASSMPRPTARPFQHPEYHASHQFFSPRPTYYYFVNTHRDAASFMPHFANKPFMQLYVTPSPLHVLLSMMTAGSKRDSFAYHRQTPARPAYVSAHSYYPERMSQLMGRLMAQSVLFELVNTLGRTNEKRTFNPAK